VTKRIIPAFVCASNSRFERHLNVLKKARNVHPTVQKSMKTSPNVLYKESVHIWDVAKKLTRVSGCLGTSRGSSRRASGCFDTSRGLSPDSSSTTSPHAGSSSTTSPTLHVRVPRLVARLVVDYFTYATRPVPSARRAACRVTHRQLLRLVQARRRLLRLRRASGASTRRAAHHTARRRLLRLRRASGCLGTSRGSSRDSSRRSSSTTSPTSCVQVPRHAAQLVAPLVVDYSASRRLVVNYFAYTTRPGASARRAARRRLLRLRRASRCLGMSRGSSRGSSRCSLLTTPPCAGSSSTTLPTLRVQVPRHVARLVVD
jgi:hypothetical protein